jgi:hypothetical protein
MIVRTYWPCATIDDTMLQITDRIEKKLQETPSLRQSWTPCFAA